MTRTVVKQTKNGHRTDPPLQSTAWMALSFKPGSRGSWALGDPLHRLSDCPLERLDLVLIPNPSPTPSSAGWGFPEGGIPSLMPTLANGT